MPSQISKGETFTDVSPGKSVTSTRLNNHVDSATLLPGAITEQTELTATAGTDLVLGSSAGVLKKIQLTNLLPPEAITDRDEITTIADADFMLVSDTDAASALKKVSPSDVLPPEAITGKSAIDAIADGDSLLVSDASASNALKKVSPSSVLPPEAITGKSELTATASGDQLLIHDATAATVLKRVTLANLLPVFTVDSVALATGTMYSGAHSLGATPRLVRWVLVCGSADAQYDVGDELDASLVCENSNNMSNFSFGANATTVWLSCDSTTTMKVPDKDSGNLVTLTAAKWTAKCYAFL